MRSLRRIGIPGLLVLCAMLAGLPAGAARQWRAFTTVMEVGAAKTDSARMTELAGIATSQTVKNQALDTLFRMSPPGPAPNYESVVSSVTAKPHPDTHLLMIQVIGPTPEEAKAAADVITAEFAAYHKELMAKDAKGKDHPAIKVVDPAQATPIRTTPAILVRLINALPAFAVGTAFGIVLTRLTGLRRRK